MVLELVDARDKRLKGAKKKKTKVVKKTLQPVWNEEVVWEDLKDDPADVFLKVSAPPFCGYFLNIAPCILSSLFRHRWSLGFT